MTAEDIRQIIENAEISDNKKSIKKKERVIIHTPKDEEKVEQISFLRKGNIIYEQVYDQDTETSMFVYLNMDGSASYCDYVHKNGIKYIPIDCKRAVDAGAIRLPDKPMEYEKLSKLISEIQQYIHKYVDVAPNYEKFSTWYVIFSWVLDNIHTVPYLRVLGDWGSGKSRFLKTVGSILYKPMSLITPTAPVIFRTIETWQGSLVLDEFTPNEKVDDTDPMMQVLCGGFERGMPVSRCENNTHKLQYFNVFGAKLFSSRRRFKDEALESRCLTEIVAETDREDIPTYLPDEFTHEQRILRNKLLMFRLRHTDDIDIKTIQNLEFPPGIPKRYKQSLAGFASLFVFDEKAMQEFMEFVKKYAQESKEDRSTTYPGMIINSIFNLKKNGYENISAKDIAQEMLDSFGVANREGNPVSPKSIGINLKILKVSTKQRRIGNVVKRVIEWDEKLFRMLENKFVVADNLKLDDETQQSLF